MRDLTKLVCPFPQKVIKTNPSGGGSYVAHPVVEQRLIDVLGRPPVTEIRDLIRGDVAAIPPNPSGSSKRAKEGRPALTGAVVGCVLRMSMTIDGEPWHSDEVGDCEDPHNWPHDGARAKDAASDAYKRVAMRAGVALHLWAQENFYLFDKLMKADDAASSDPGSPAVPFGEAS